MDHYQKHGIIGEQCYRYGIEAAMDSPNNPWTDRSVFDQAPNGTFFYWSQPQLGYYKNQDKWVLRRHIAWQGKPLILGCDESRQPDRLGYASHHQFTAGAVFVR